MFSVLQPPQHERVLAPPGKRNGVANLHGIGEIVLVAEDRGKILHTGTVDGELHRRAAIFDV
ncbi:hypothetical protein D3C87_2162530 [compost metagenome]